MTLFFLFLWFIFILLKKHFGKYILCGFKKIFFFCLFVILSFFSININLKTLCLFFRNDFFHNRTYHMYEQLACYYLAVLYFGLLLATSVMFYLTVRREASFWTTQKVTFLFIMLSCVGRTAFFALLPDGPWNFQAKSFDLFWTQPALFIFTTFTVMLFHWAKVKKK